MIPTPLQVAAVTERLGEATVHAVLVELQREYGCTLNEAINAIGESKLTPRATAVEVSAWRVPSAEDSAQ